MMIIMGCASKDIVPEWYEKRAMSIDNWIFGYGTGNSFEEAKQNAFKDIAQNIKSKVKSRQVSSKKKIISSYHKDYVSQFLSDTEIFSNVILNDVKLEKQQFINGRYFVVYKYDDSSLISKLIVGKNKCQAKTNTNTSLKSYLPFSQSLLEYNILPDDFLLIRHNKLWYLYYLNHKYLISPSEWFGEFFIEKKYSKELSISILPQKKLKNHDYYFIKIISEKNGFISLFHITEKGEVLSLEVNKKINAFDEFIYPDIKKYKGLEALKSDQKITRDCIVAVLTKAPNQNLTTFMSVSEKITDVNDERNYRYHRLLEFIDENCWWVSKFIEIY